MTTIVLWICVCADDWAAELAVKASNDLGVSHAPIPPTNKYDNTFDVTAMFLAIDPIPSKGGK